MMALEQLLAITPNVREMCKAYQAEQRRILLACRSDYLDLLDNDRSESESSAAGMNDLSYISTKI